MNKTKMSDNDLLNIMLESLITDFYFFGAYTDYGTLPIPPYKP